MGSAVQWLDARALEVSKWNKFDVGGRERYGRDMPPPPYHRVCHTTSTEDVGGLSLARMEILHLQAPVAITCEQSHVKDGQQQQPFRCLYCVL